MSLSTSTSHRDGLLSTERTDTSDEVLRRLGRNLLYFQKIEYALKQLLARSEISGPVEKLAEIAQSKASLVNKQTLGNLVEKFKTSVLCDAGESIPEAEMQPGSMAFSFKISGEAGFIEGVHRDLAIVTSHRNELVHHFLPRWQPGNEEALTDALAYLDTQRDAVLPMHKQLMSHLEQRRETLNLFVEFISSSEGQSQFELPWLQTSPLVKYLLEIAAQFHRQDGWTYLAQAGSLAARDVPDEMTDLEVRYGFKTLKQLLVGAKIFEVLDEPLTEGRFRTLYRPKRDT